MSHTPNVAPAHPAQPSVEAIPTPNNQPAHHPPNPPGEELLKPSEVAQRWSCSIRTVQRYIADGRLPCKRLPGGHARIRAADAQKFLT